MDCPDDQTIALLRAVALDDNAASALRDHLGSCEKCAAIGLEPTSPSPTTAAAPSTVSMPARESSVAIGEPHVGLVVGGRYRLIRWLGEGGMGTVWAAEHLVTHERFALKLIRTSRAHRPSTRRRMLREARVANAVRHPNVVRVVDAFEADLGTPVLVMDLLEGRTLRQRLRAGRLSVDEAARLLVPAMAAIKSAHAAGIVHRDLKPDNLFLVEMQGGREDMRVLDFGLARFIPIDANSSQLTGSGEMMGTPSYMSPEQAFGATDLDERSDVWAMGVILYECLSGRRPFDGENFGQVLKRITSGERTAIAEAAPGVPPDVAELIEKMLTVPRESRLADLGAAIEVLSRHGAGDVEARVIRPRRKAWLALAIGAAVAVAAATTGLILMQSRSHRVAPSAPVTAAAAPPAEPAAPPPPEPKVAVPVAAPPSPPAKLEPAPRPVGGRPTRNPSVRAPAATKTAAPAAAKPPRVLRENDL